MSLRFKPEHRRTYEADPDLDVCKFKKHKTFSFTLEVCFNFHPLKGKNGSQFLTLQ